LFPADNWWNTNITNAPLDAKSASFITFIGGAGRQLHPDFGGYVDPGPPPGDEIYGFPYVVITSSDDLSLQTVQFDYADESDGVDHNNGDTSFPFYPIPDLAKTQPYWIEGGPSGDSDPDTVPGADGDRHMLIVDKAHNTLYELFHLRWDGSQWTAGSGAFFNMATNNRRTEGWTSADAAGLAILPGLVRYDEVFGPDPINHAFRVTVQHSNGHVYPGSHTAGSFAGALPMGARLRLKASKDISGFPPAMQKIFQAMKTYGLIVADNGTNMYISGTFDPNWDNDVLNPAFGALHASDFEVIKLGWKPPTAQIQISDPAPISEGNAGSQSLVFTVTLSEPSTDTISVTYATSPGTATPGIDYVTKTGLLTFTPNSTSRTVAVTVRGDMLDEDDETFFLNLSHPVNGLLPNAQAQATILNDDVSPSLSVADLAVTEGDSGATNALFKVTLSAVSGRAVSVDYATADGSASAGSDYQAVSGTLTIPAGKLSGVIAVPVLGDQATEPSESFTLNLSSPVNATILEGQAVGTILDNDSLPSINVNDIVVTEGTGANTSALFAVSLSAATNHVVTVHYTTVAGTALAGADFKTTAGTLTFGIGVTNQPVTVPVVADNLQERNEVFLLRVSAPVGAKLGRSQGQAVIVNDDGAADVCLPILAVPITISNPGSYCLARSVTTPIRSGAAIELAADGISLDLQGFTLAGTGGVRTQAAGIHADQHKNISITNGTVRGFLAGVLLTQPPPYLVPQGLSVDHVKAIANFEAGLWLEGEGSTVTHSTVTTTGRSTAFGPMVDGVGILLKGPAAAGSGVSDSVVSGTVGLGGGTGFGVLVSGGSGTTIARNVISGVASHTTGLHFDASPGAVVNSNQFKTLTYGIVFANGSTGPTLSGNTFTGVATPVVGGP
jgi:hypothetical protein